MKRINKTPGPNELTKFAANHPDADWDSGFRNSNGGEDYKQLRNRVFSDQGGLCAYCEQSVGEYYAHKQRVEHYHSKSDTSTPGKNWALDWDNVIGVCIGGEDSNQSHHPLPANLSCDAYKNHLINLNQLTEACEGYYINPLRIIATPCLFGLNKRTGELTVNVEACEKLADIDCHYESTAKLVEHTIKILNLNCQRLMDDRIAVLRDYNQELARYRKHYGNNPNGPAILAARWFSQRWPRFFTTRRIILGEHAEAYLMSIKYSG